MVPDKRSELEEKKACLQELLKIRSYCNTHLKPWLRLYDELVDSGIQPNIKYLASTFDHDPKLFLQAIEEQVGDSRKQLLEKVIQEESLPVHRQLEEKYPTINPIRYLPDGNSFISEDILPVLKNCLDDLQVTDKSCMILYPIYSPVLEIKITDLLSVYDQIFEPMTDVCLIALDYSWIIFRSLEDEWVCVRK